MQAYISKSFHKTVTASLTVFLFITILFQGLVSCQKDKVAERGYPRVMTLDVKEITQNSAIFSAEIISGDPSEVIKYGFVWSGFSDSPRLGNNDSNEITGSLGSGNFSSDIQNLLNDHIYYLRGYVKTSTLLIYGRVVAFRTLK